MAIDTATKRRWLLGYELPEPDGADSAGKRAELLGLYYISVFIAAAVPACRIYTAPAAASRTHTVPAQNRIITASC